jgi:hypothetical protein
VPLLDREPPEDLDTSNSVSPSGLLGALKVGAVILAAIVGFTVLVETASSRFNLDFDAVFWIAAGAVLLVLTLVRPWWFWYHAKAVLVRRLLTDPGAIALYLLITGGLILTGVRRQVAITHAREECRRLLTAANDPHERVKALYGRGAQNIPQVEGEPRAFSCERLLETR